MSRAAHEISRWHAFCHCLVIVNAMRAQTMLFVLLASGCAESVIAPRLAAEREPGVGEIDVSPSGALFRLEPLEGSTRGIRRYDGDRIIDTVPVPEMALTSTGEPNAPATLVALDDRVFVGELDIWSYGPGLVTLWQWDGDAWTDVLAMFGGDWLRASRPRRDGAGVTWVAAGDQAARLGADHAWSFVDLPRGLATIGVVAPLPDGLRVVASDGDGERSSVIDVAGDMSARILGTVDRHLAKIEGVGALDGRPVLVAMNDGYRAQVVDLEGAVLAEIPFDAEVYDTCNTSDGALWILVREYLYERFIAVRIEGASDIQYVGEIPDQRTAYDAVTHLSPDRANGVWLYGAGIYHATPRAER